MNEECVIVANGKIQAEQVRTFLEASGMVDVLRGESLTKTHGLTLDGLGRVEVLVAGVVGSERGICSRPLKRVSSGSTMTWRLGEGWGASNEGGFHRSWPHGPGHGTQASGRRARSRRLQPDA